MAIRGGSVERRGARSPVAATVLLRGRDAVGSFGESQLRSAWGRYALARPARARVDFLDELRAACRSGVREPVRFWSARRYRRGRTGCPARQTVRGPAPVIASPAELRRRTEVERDRALARLRAVHRTYWDRDWRFEHREGGR
ncbi:DUF7711 family protein [Nocardia sp. CA-135953]|uniref:DUF7711 family protein n=1 Tax=Nocardia sp. CA-135953 TaxID=3239978 RepID=UPI003D965D91